MKKNKKFLIILFGLISLISFNSCSKESLPTKGNIVIWTKSNSFIGDKIIVSRDSVVGNVNWGPKNINIGTVLISKVTTEYKPVCGDLNCINLELDEGSYHISTVRLVHNAWSLGTSGNYVKIHTGKGDCNTLEIK